MTNRSVASVVAATAAFAGIGLVASSAEASRPSRHAAMRRAPLPVFVAGSYRGRYPTQIDISGDAGNIVTGLRWSRWTRYYAYAVGTSNIQSCVPDCADGSETPVRTTILLQDASRKGYFTKLTERRDGRTEVFRFTPGHTPDNWPGGAS